VYVQLFSWCIHVIGSESSFVASERNNQQIVQRDEKIDHLLKQIQQVQVGIDHPLS
jgi:hypothetical protein